MGAERGASTIGLGSVHRADPANGGFTLSNAERFGEPTIERVQVTHLPGRYGGRITHPWQWELTAPDGEVRYFDTKREALAWWDELRKAAGL